MMSIFKFIISYFREIEVTKEDTRPRYKVEQFGNKHYMYTLNKPFLCPDVHYYRYTGNSLNSGRFKEVEACLKNGAVLFKSFIAIQVT